MNTNTQWPFEKLQDEAINEAVEYIKNLKGKKEKLLLKWEYLYSEVSIFPNPNKQDMNCMKNFLHVRCYFHHTTCLSLTGKGSYTECNKKLHFLKKFG